MIPKILQFHWFEDHLPSWGEIAIEKYRDLFPDWEIVVHREYPNDMPEKYKKAMLKAPHPRYRADLVRWWLLYRDGGIYVDLDTLPNRRFDDLLNFTCFFPRLYGTHRYLDIFFIGAEPGLSLFHEALEGCCYHNEGPHPGTWFYIENVLPQVEYRSEVVILPTWSAKEIKRQDRIYNFLEKNITPTIGKYDPAYLLHYCHYRARTRPALRQSLLDEQATKEQRQYLIERFGEPQSYPERPPEPKPQDIAWRKMPDGDLVVDPGGKIPEEPPEGYERDPDKPYRFHLKSRR